MSMNNFMDISGRVEFKCQYCGKTVVSYKSSIRVGKLELTVCDKCFNKLKRVSENEV